MAWVRSLQCGFEFRDVNELEQYAGKGTSTGSISTTTVYSGTASLQINASSRPRGKALSGTDKVCVRCGCYFRYAGVGVADEGIIFYIPGSTDISITFDEDDGLVRIRVGGSVVASDTPANVGISTTAVWYNFGLYVYRSATVGVIDFYVGGTSKLSFTGNTGTYNSGIYVGGEETATAWDLNTFVDDFWGDYSLSQESNLAPPAYTYTLLRPTADGTPTDWVCSTGTDNYANVDDVTPDDDTTYNYATAIDVIDEFTITDFSLPSGFVINSVIPVARVKKAGVTDAQIQLGLDQGGTEEYATAQSIATTYAYYFDRFTDDPTSAAWSDSNIDSIKLQIKSTGTF